MKSLCIKENNIEIINFINNRLSNIDLDCVLVKNLKFKIYNNIIIHYTKDSNNTFYDRISQILADTIIYFYERKLIKRIIEYNYFYFSGLEKKEIIDIAESFIKTNILTEEDNYLSICSAVSDYIMQNKSLVLEGFVNFRLQNYMKNLDYIVDLAVNKFITDKEYLEFVNMLKLYVTLTPPKSLVVHLIYFRRR